MTCARTLGISLFILIALAPLSARASESISAAPSLASNDGADGGTANWNSSSSTASLAGAVRGVGGAYAEVSLEANKQVGAEGVVSKYLYANGFNFSLPEDASILGITVTLERRAGTAGFIHDSEARLVSGTTASPVNEAHDNALWSSDFATVTYGSANDLWGDTWTPAAINDNSFGVFLSVTNTDLDSGHTARVDSVLVTVAYTLRGNPIFATQEYSIPLTAGWNLVSTPVAPEDAAIADIIATTSADTVWSYDPGDSAAESGWLLYDKALPLLSNLSTMRPGYGYFVHASTTSTLSVTGALFAPGASPPARSLSSGWNLVGSYAGSAEDIDDAFASIGWAGLEYLSLWKLDAATQAFKLPQAVLPGDGFWILLDAPHTYAPADL